MPSTVPAQDPTGTSPPLAELELPVFPHQPCLGFTTALLPCSHHPSDTSKLDPHGRHPSPPPLAKAVRPRLPGGQEGNSRGARVHLPSLPASPGRQSSAPTAPPGLAASGGAAAAAPAGKGGRCRWGPADVCQRAQLLCQGALAGGCVDPQRSALHLPAPPVAFRAYVRCPPPGLPPPAPPLPGDPGGGSREL